jgi:hypothetical protein
MEKVKNNKEKKSYKMVIREEQSRTDDLRASSKPSKSIEEKAEFQRHTEAHAKNSHDFEL